MKYVKGASKHEQAVPCQSGWRSPAGGSQGGVSSQPAGRAQPGAKAAPSSPRPGSCRQKGAWSSLAGEGEGALWKSRWTLH